MSRILEHEVQGDLGAKENRAGEEGREKREGRGGMGREINRSQNVQLRAKSWIVLNREDQRELVIPDLSSNNV